MPNKSVTITARDVAIMQMAWRGNLVISVGNIKKHLFPQDKASQWPRQLMYRLAQGSYFRQLTPAHSDSVPTKGRFYALMSKGRTALFDHTEALIAPTKDFCGYRSYDKIRHDIGLQDTFYSLLRDAKNVSNLSIRELWAELDLRRLNIRVKTHDPFTSKAGGRGLMPDGFISLDQSRGDGTKALGFFLEFDRTTETGIRIAREKMAAYKSYLKRGFAKHFGLSTAKVLFVTTTEARIRNLIDMAKAAGVQRIFSFATYAAVKASFASGTGNLFTDSIWYRDDAETTYPLLKF